MNFTKIDIPENSFKIGQKVGMTNQHPWEGYIGTIVRMEMLNTSKEIRPVVKLEANDHEVFIIDDSDAEIIG